MQDKYSNGYSFYDADTQFGLTFSGFGGFNINRALKTYRYAHAAALRLIAAVEHGEAVNTHAVVEEAENRPVDHFNLRDVGEQVPGKTLAQSKALWHSIRTYAEGLVAEKAFDHVIFNGIGGSYLGPYMLLVTAHGDEYNMKMRQLGRPTLHFTANTDPESFGELLKTIDIRRTAMVVISKSGSTAETATNAATFLALLGAAGVGAPASHMLVVTTPGSNLEKRALADGYRKVFHMNEATGGRTSIVSAVGMVPAAFGGVDFAAFLDGMAQMDCVTRRADPLQNPALLYATLLDYNLKYRAQPYNIVILAYTDAFKHYSHYCQQLFMESLGKDYTRDGLPAKAGISIFGGVGTGEQHAFMQQIQKGCHDSVVRFIRYRCRDTDYADAAAGSMGRQLLAFAKGTEMALYSNERSFVTTEVERADVFCLGELVAFEERVVTILSAFWNINAYDQPGVQDGKLACGVCNRLGARIVEALAQAVGGARRPFTRLAAADVLALLGVVEPPVTVPGTRLGESESLAAWMADSILSDIASNIAVEHSYPTLRGAITLDRAWDGQRFVYTAAPVGPAGEKAGSL